MTLQAKAKPDSPTVIYDGVCSFCNLWIERLARWDRENILRFIPLQTPEALELSGRTAEELGHAIHLVNPDGSMFTGASAVRHALLRTHWRIPVRILASLPWAMFIAERIYERVAGSRYSLGCDGVTCGNDKKVEKND